MAEFTWASAAGRYRGPDGRFVAEATVRQGVDALVQTSASRMAGLASQYRAGEITAAQWLTAHCAEVKAVNVAAAVAAYGGREAMTPQRWGLVGSIVRREYAFSRQMVADAMTGRVRLNGRLDARSAMYAASARQTYTAIQRREAYERGSRYERNVLGAAEHCPDCVGQTGIGWVPMGTLSQPGTRRCRSNCACRLEYANQRPVESLAS